MAMKTESVAKTERPDNSSIENVAMFMSSGGRSGHEVQVIQKHTCMLGMVLLESNLNRAGTLGVSLREFQSNLEKQVLVIFTGAVVEHFDHTS